MFYELRILPHEFASAGVLEMAVIIILIYSLGAELKYGTSRHLLKTRRRLATDRSRRKACRLHPAVISMGLFGASAVDWMHPDQRVHMYMSWTSSCWFWQARRGDIHHRTAARSASGIEIGALYSILAFSFSGLHFL